MKQAGFIALYVISTALAAVGGYQYHAYQTVYKQEADAKAFFDIGTNEKEKEVTFKSIFGMKETKEEKETKKKTEE